MKNYKIDREKTYISIGIFLVFVLIFLYYLYSYMIFLGTIQDASIRIIGLIVFAFSIIKLSGYIGYPTIYEESIK